jgi:hypothetical protein
VSVTGPSILITMEIRGTPWRKYGHDRTYLKDEAGTRLGWVDNKTGKVTVDAEEHRASLETWVANNVPAPPCAAEPAANEPAVDVESQDPVAGEPGDHPHTQDVEPAVDAEPEWADLNANRPGQAAREQADAHLAEMKGRSRIMTALVRALDVNSDERSWRVGAKGEESIGSRLDKLTEHGWHVLHAVPIGSKGSDIDHLLIGPGGVWTLNTKNHPEKKIWVSPRQVRVDGHVVPYLRNSEFEATRVRRILTEHLGWEPFVKAGLVFLTGSIVPDVTIKQMPDDVLILDRLDIPRAFKKSPQRLTPDGIEEIYEIARRSTSWA